MLEYYLLQKRLLREHKKTLLSMGHSELLYRNLKMGSLKAIDAPYLGRLIANYKPKSILEIGTFIGVSTRFLLEVSKKYDTSIDCVDPCIKHRSFTSILETRIRIISKQYEARVNHLIGFWSDQPVKGFEEYSIYNPINIDKKYDFVFIDGDHTYESVKRDFELAKQCLTSQGVIAFHDIYSWEGVA